MGPTPKDPVERYLAKVDRQGPDECWPWTAACFEKGYGAFRLGNKQLKAHRFGYETFVGPIADGLYVCHTCDNPPCQNPNHWFLGTHLDNALDRKAKGRGATGTKNGGFKNARFTPEQVREIRLAALDGVTQPELARRFGAHQAQISQIVLRKVWNHLDQDLPRPKPRKVSDEDIAAMRAERLATGISMAALGEKYGIHWKTVSYLLQGDRPKTRTPR